MNAKWVLVLLTVSMLLALLIGTQRFAKAQTAAEIVYPGGVTLYSPLNETYSSQFLTLNVSFGWGLGLQCSLNYSVDGNYEGYIPLVCLNPPGVFNVVNPTAGSLQLPQLSDGTHCLTIYEAACVSWGCPNPPGAPFKPLAPGEYAAYWTDTVYFAIDTQTAAQMPICTAEVATPPIITDFSIRNQTYNTTNISLTFKVNHDISKAAYSLDGKNNVTIAENSNLEDLTTGTHNITFFAWNQHGTASRSRTIQFTIAKTTSPTTHSQEPNPAGMVVVSSASAASIIIIWMHVLKNRRAKK